MFCLPIYLSKLHFKVTYFVLLHYHSVVHSQRTNFKIEVFTMTDVQTFSL